MLIGLINAFKIYTLLGVPNAVSYINKSIMATALSCPKRVLMTDLTP